MQGPARLIRSDRIANYKNIESLFDWVEDSAYLVIDKVMFNDKAGAILCYHNPPIHQIGTTGLHAFHDGLDVILKKKSELQFLILCGSNAPVHSGGDLKESLFKLKESLASKRELEDSDASTDDINRLFSWGEERLEKGIILYKKIRSLARVMRVVAVCGGGLRYGGSAEIPLMTDYIIGDSRSGMCFSESLIGIIPGWGGITRVLVKSGLLNAAYMAKTANPVYAGELKDIGIFNSIVEIPFELPRMKKTGNLGEDKEKYLKLLEDHDDMTGALLLPEALKWATYPVDDLPSINEKKIIVESTEIELEVSRRVEPNNYKDFWGKPLKSVKYHMERLGRPLAPQSIDAIDRLLKNYDPSSFNEEQSINDELWADAALYRDPRFLEGLSAQLEQRVPDFRNKG